METDVSPQPAYLLLARFERSAAIERFERLELPPTEAILQSIPNQIKRKDCDHDRQVGIGGEMRRDQ